MSIGRNNQDSLYILPLKFLAKEKDISSNEV